MLGEYFSNRLVRFTIGRWGSCANMQLSIANASYFIVLCARMDSYRNDSVVAGNSNAGLEFWR